MTALADELVPDELWALVEPLLPVPPRPPYGGRRRAVSAHPMSHRMARQAVLELGPSRCLWVPRSPLRSR